MMGWLQEVVAGGTNEGVGAFLVSVADGPIEES